MSSSPSMWKASFLRSLFSRVLIELSLFSSFFFSVSSVVSFNFLMIFWVYLACNFFSSLNISVASDSLQLEPVFFFFSGWNWLSLLPLALGKKNFVIIIYIVFTCNNPFQLSITRPAVWPVLDISDGTLIVLRRRVYIVMKRRAEEKGDQKLFLYEGSPLKDRMRVRTK